MWKEIVMSVLLVGLLSSFNYDKSKVREGYYFSTHGHASTLYKIGDNKIEWYSDNVIKLWGCGKYTINEVDSVIKISYDEIWRSAQPNQRAEFEVSLKIKWDKAKNIFELSEYEYREKTDAIEDLKKRVKASSKIKVGR